MRGISLILFALLTLFDSAYARAISEDAPALPLVIWHGLGDRYNNDGLVSVGDVYKELYPNSFVYNIRLDEDGQNDQSATFFGNLNEQLEKVCADLAIIKELSHGFHGLGFSQGGQFLRGYVERCNSPPVSTLMTFGSQHNGIAEFQACGDSDWVCKGYIRFLKGNAWSDLAQTRLVPAQYYRNPSELDQYLNHSNYLADINNERELKNETYKKNLGSLDLFVMYLFAEDTTVIPKESGWFADVDQATGVVTKLQDRRLFTEDWIGLKGLDEKKKLVFDTIPGRHMQFSDKLLIKAFTDYMGPRKAGKTEVVLSGL